MEDSTFIRGWDWGGGIVIWQELGLSDVGRFLKRRDTAKKQVGGQAEHNIRKISWMQSARAKGEGADEGVHQISEEKEGIRRSSLYVIVLLRREEFNGESSSGHHYLGRRLWYKIPSLGGRGPKNGTQFCQIIHYLSLIRIGTNVQPEGVRWLD